MRTGKPIVYTSADSVFQIAAHEDVIPIDEQYRINGVAFDLAVGGHGLGRVIARPFVGEPGSFTRTSNRHDFAMPPTAETVLDRLTAAGIPIVAIGKIEDLFAGRGISRGVHTAERRRGHGCDRRARWKPRRAGLIFANLVDFDTLYGHRNDVEGYAANLERFDARLRAAAAAAARRRSADRDGRSWQRSRRRRAPIIRASMCRCWRRARGVKSDVDLGTRQTFADLGQTIAENFGVGPMKHGTSFLDTHTVRLKADATDSYGEHS